MTVAAVTSQDAGSRGRYVGRVQAINTVNLQARVEGFLEKREFTEGGLVKKGDLLYVIEKSLYQADVAQIQGHTRGCASNLEELPAQS